MWGQQPHVGQVPMTELLALEEAGVAVLRASLNGTPPADDVETLAKLATKIGSGRRPRAAAPGQPVEVTSQSLRLPLRDLADDALPELRRFFRLAQARAAGVEDSPLAAMTSNLAYIEETARRGRPPAPDKEVHLRAVAAAWQNAWQEGSRRPTSDVADQFHVSKSTAAKWIRECRQPAWSLLPPSGGRGRPTSRRGQ